MRCPRRSWTMTSPLSIQSRIATSQPPTRTRSCTQGHRLVHTYSSRSRSLVHRSMAMLMGRRQWAQGIRMAQSTQAIAAMYTREIEAALIMLRNDHLYQLHRLYSLSLNHSLRSHYAHQPWKHKCQDPPSSTRCISKEACKT